MKWKEDWCKYYYINIIVSLDVIGPWNLGIVFDFLALFEASTAASCASSTDEAWKKGQCFWFLALHLRF